MTTAQAPLPSGFGIHTTAREAIAGHDLHGKTIVVTGGYSGLGLEATRAFVELGAHVIVPARTRAKAVANLAGLEIELEELDLFDPASIDAFAARVIASGRPLHALVNSAGINRTGPSHQLATADWQRVIEIDLSGTYYACHAGVFTSAEFVRAVGTALTGRPPRVLPLPAVLARVALEITGAAARLAGRATILTPDKANEFFQPAWTGDPAPLLRDSGWQARHDLASGLQATAQWYREQRWL